MAVILAFAPSVQPRTVAVAVHHTAPRVRRPAGVFSWVRDPETGRLVCRYDAELAEPDPLQKIA